MHRGNKLRTHGFQDLLAQHHICILDIEGCRTRTICAQSSRFENLIEQRGMILYSELCMKILVTGGAGT